MQASKKRKSDPFVDAISTFGKNMLETVAQKNTAEKSSLKYDTTWKYIESLYEKILDKKRSELELKFVAMVMEAVQEESDKH